MHERIHFVNNIKLKRSRLPYLCQDLLIFNNVLVCGQQHVELAAAQDGNKCTSRSWRPLKYEQHNCINLPSLECIFDLRF